MRKLGREYRKQLTEIDFNQILISYEIGQFLKLQGFWVHQSCSLSTSCVSKDKQVVQPVSWSVSQQRSDPVKRP